MMNNSYLTNKEEFLKSEGCVNGFLLGRRSGGGLVCVD